MSNFKKFATSLHKYTQRGIMQQQGGHYMQEHQQPKQMSPQAVIGACVSVMRLTIALGATTTSHAQPTRNELKWRTSHAIEFGCANCYLCTFISFLCSSLYNIL